jgi:hypothetical protein
LIFLFLLRGIFGPASIHQIYGPFMDDNVLKQLGVVRRSEVALFVLGHYTRMIAKQDGSVYSTRCSAAYPVYGENQWQRRLKRTALGF